MARKVLAAVLNGVRNMSIREFDMPQLGADDGLLKVEMVGICGSDYATYTGKMKAPNFPLIMGHEILGRIEQIGEVAARRQGVSEGDRVVVEARIPCGACYYCLTGNYKLCRKAALSYGGLVSVNEPPSLWGAYAQYMYLAPGTVLHRISQDVPAEAAVLACAVIGNGIQWASRLPQTSIGDAVVIQGAGPQGLACTIAAKEAGASPVILTGLGADEEQRFTLGKKFGADYCINVEKDDVVKRVKDMTDGNMADVVVDVTGNAQAIVTSIDLARPQGTVVCAGDVGDGVVSPIETRKILVREIRFQGALSRGVEAVNVAVKLIESKKYAFEEMVTHKFPLAEAEKGVLTVGGEIDAVRAIKAVIVP